MSMFSVSKETTDPWKAIDALMEKPALTSAGEKLKDLQKKVDKSGTDADKVRALIYRLAIDMGCEYALPKNDNRRRIPNNSSEEAIEVIIEAYKNAEKLSPTLKDSVPMSILAYMKADLLREYSDIKGLRRSHRSEVKTEGEERKDDITEWSYEEVKKRIRVLLKEANKNIEAMAKVECETYGGLFKETGDKKAHSTVADFIVNGSIDLLESIDKEDDIMPQRWEEENFFMSYDKAEKGQSADMAHEWLRRLVAAHRGNGNTEAMIYADTDRLEYEYKYGTRFRYDGKRQRAEAYIKALDALINAHPDNKATAFAISQKVDVMMDELRYKCKSEEFDQERPKEVLQICNKAIEKYGNAYGTGAIRRTIATITRRELDYSIEENIVTKGGAAQLVIRNTNIDEAILNIYKITLTAEQLREKPNETLSRYLKKVATKTLKLTHSNYYIQATDTFALPTDLDYGKYAMEVADPKAKSEKWKDYVYFDVTDLDIVNADGIDNEVPVFVVNRKSGLPVGGANVILYNYKYGNSQNTFVGQKVTSADGVAKMDMRERNKKPLRIYAEKGADRYLQSVSPYIWNKQSGETSTQANIYTDRNIYRPGQTVRMKGIVYTTSPKEDHLEIGKTYKVSLIDANWQTVETKTVSTNGFGSFDCDFVLPKDALLGQYTIKVSREDDTWLQNTRISVEEYKRPSFEVSLNGEIEKAEFGKEVVMKGEAKRLSGEPVAGAKVKIEIEKRNLFGWRSGFASSETRETQETTTDEEGKFEVKFIPARAENASDDENDVERFTVTATITEEGGETREGRAWFTVADRDIHISINGAEVIEKREAMLAYKHHITIEANNVNGMPKEARVIVEVKNRKTEVVISKETITANGKTGYNLPLEKMNAGQYIVTATEDADDPKKGKAEWKFDLYDKVSNDMPTDDLLWTNTKSIEIADGEKTQILVGSAEKDAHILMLVFVNNRWIEDQTKWIEASNCTKKIEIDANAIFEKGNRAQGANIYLTTIKNGKRQSMCVSVSKKKEDKSLKVSLETFRDKVTPGAKEKWTLKVVGMKDTTEVLCGMYDKSLDAYRVAVPWLVLRGYSFYLYGGDITSVVAQRRGGMYSQPLNIAEKEDGEPMYAKGLWKDAIGRYNPGRGIRLGGRMMYSLSAKRALPELKLAENDMAIEDEEIESDEGAVFYGIFDAARGEKKGANLNDAPVAACLSIDFPMQESSGLETSAGSVDMAKVDLRTNFAESVFFYPQLKTDKDGRVTFEFEMPHSLTKWNFRAFAHTRDMRSGGMQQDIVTQQPFTVRPTMPRFMRVGDDAHIGVTVVNFSSEEKEAEVVMVWKNAETGKEIKKETKKADLTKKQTTVDFGIKVPDGVAAIEITVAAKSGDFTDGERHLLAVLPNGMRVCKSVNIFAKRGETKKAKLPEIEKEATDIRYTMEYSANAAWNAVMALHSVKNTSENAIDLAIALYTDATLGNIAQTYPGIRAAVQKWQETEVGKERNVSPLEQNAELKSLLLKETPWVMEAKTETQWRQEICDALDTKRTAKSCNDIVKTMEKLQNEDGGLAWFPGLWSSCYTTTIVCRYMARLEKRGLLSQVSGAEKMLGKAAKYLDESIVKDYEEQKKYSKKAEPSDWHLEVMMLRMQTKDKHSIGIKAKGIYNEYREYAVKNWKDFTLYGKSMLVIMLSADGKASEARKIAEAISEGATRTAENGMYWKENLDNFRWNGNAVTKHTLAMRALDMARANADEQDEMAIWLVQRKRTTMWENPIEAADAAEAIMTSLKGGANAIASPKKTTIEWGGKTITTSDENTGEQYVKATAENVVANADAYKEMSVTQSDNSIGYGAVYASYYCPYDAIKAAKSGVGVNKKTYLCVQSNDGGKQKEVMKEVKEGAKLKVGDKLKVVLTLKNDQDLDFVCLKDLRAACQEPTISLSGREVMDNLYLYRSTTDTGVRYFFDHLPKGTWVMEYTVYVSAHGAYTAGVATVQSVYAPSFQGNSGNGVKVVVE